MNHQKRITMRTVGLQTADLEDIAEGAAGKEVSVLRVYGSIIDTEQGKSEIGPYTKFKGQFEAVNLVSGDKSRSYVLILPSVGEDMALGMLSAIHQEDPKAAATFGIEITVRKYKPKNDKGFKFTYGAKSLGEDPVEDALAIIGKQFGATPLLTDKTSKGPVSKKK